MNPKILKIDAQVVWVTWRTDWVFVRVELEDGSIGWGEASDAQIAQIARPRFAALAQRYVGLTVDSALQRITADVETAARALGASREWPADCTLLGGIDQALCDLAACASGVSLAVWLGAPPGTVTVPLYANINRGVRERTPAEFRRVARAAVKAGFEAIKCAPFDFLVGDRRVETGLLLAEAVRDEIGGDIDLMLDAHHHLSLGEIGAVSGRLRDLNLRWVEDVAHIDDPGEVQRVKDILDVPQAAGESATRIDQVEVALVSGALDVFMPDVKHAGGIRAALALGRVAAEAGVEVSIHSPTGPVSTVASVHAAAAISTSRILEYAFGEVEWRSDLACGVEDGLRGTFRLSEQTLGLGVRVDDRVARCHQTPTQIGNLHPGVAHFGSLV